MANMLLVTHGTADDVLPFLALGAALHRRGHQVTLLTHSRYAAQARASGLDFFPSDVPLARRPAAAPVPRRLTWPLAVPDTVLIDQIRLECKALAERHVPGRTVLIGRHGTCLSVRFAAEMLDAPVAWVAVSPAHAAAASATLYAYETVLATGLAEVREELGLPPITDWRAWAERSDLALGLWPEWFDRAGRATEGRFTLTGFVAPEAEPGDLPEAAARLLAGPSPVLVTDAAEPDWRFLRVAVAGCRRLGVPAVLTVQPPAPPPEGVYAFPGLPIGRMLPHAAALVHHGDLEPAVLGLAHGVPQVLFTDGADRPDHARRLAGVGLAAWLPAPHWTEELAASALALALRDAEYRRRCQAITGFRSGTAEAVRALESLIGGRCASAVTA